MQIFGVHGWKWPLSQEEVETFLSTAKSLVKEMMQEVARQEPAFAGYNIVLSGSTEEGVKVGDPFEIDFLLVYDIKFDRIFDLSAVNAFTGFVQIAPGDEFCELLKPFSNGKYLSSNKFIFRFLEIIYNITEGASNLKKPIHLRITKISGSGKNDVVSFKNFREKGIGAAVTVELEGKGIDRGDIDLVLAFKLGEYWPEFASKWKIEELNISQDCLNEILAKGTLAVPKVLKGYAMIDNHFRLSFSLSESVLMKNFTEDQKQSYQILKILREINFHNFEFGGLYIEDLLRGKLSTYHLKTIALTVFTKPLATKENISNSIRDWVVLLLEELIKCLRCGSIKHFFTKSNIFFGSISFLELLEYANVKEEVTCHEFISKLKPGDPHIIRPWSVPGFPKAGDVYLNSLMVRTFEKTLKTLPKDLSKLIAECKFGRPVGMLPS